MVTIESSKLWSPEIHAEIQNLIIQSLGPDGIINLPQLRERIDTYLHAHSLPVVCDVASDPANSGAVTVTFTWGAGEVMGIVA